MPYTSNISPSFFFNEAFKNLKITTERAQQLTTIANCIIKELSTTKNVHLNFICIHNSRRSQLSQVWSDFAIQFFNLKNIVIYSGGTIVTSLHRNTCKTLKEVGFHFNLLEYSHQNPVYSITYKNCVHPIIGYSKLYNCKTNNIPFIAITNCLSLEKNCTSIYDASQVFHLPYTNPKSFDGMSNQQQKYLEINLQIAGEIYFIFEKVQASI